MALEYVPVSDLSCCCFIYVFQLLVLSYHLTTIGRRSLPPSSAILYLPTSSHLHLSQLYDNG